MFEDPSDVRSLNVNNTFLISLNRWYDLCSAALPVIINEMWTQHHHLQVKDFRLRLDAEHDGGEFRVVRSVTGGHAHP